MKKQLFLLAVMCLCSLSIFAQNPVTKSKGVSDPHIRVFNDTIYLYSGHDATPNDKTWIMRDWRVFSTTDLLNWKLEETISPKDNYMGENTIDCWASDAATRNGQYYFYFSDQKRGIGVMKSNGPTGPFKDALGKPLVAPLHDPTIFMNDDENKTPYIVYGDKSDAFFIAKLNEDMVSTAEEPKRIVITGEAWKKAPHWMDKNYFFKYKDTYYLSWGRDYATSKNIYGPYNSVGALGNGHHLDQYAHGSFFWWKGQFYHIWCYYIREGYKFRESIITYCHFDDDGHIVTDTNFLDKHFANGVGQYNTSWDKIEAEWYYEISSGIEKKGTREKGFVLTGIKDGSWVKFANVNFEKVCKQFEAVFQNTKGKGSVEIRLGNPTGKLLGTVNLDEKSKETITTKIKSTTGKQDLFLKFTGNKKFKVVLDYFRLF